MVSQVLASIGLTVCIALGLHMLLGRERQRQLGLWWQGYQARFSLWRRRWSPDARAEQRRRQRLFVASQHREAIERARSKPMELDEVEWDGNVAKPKFGQARKRHLH
ncbi:hypothetical protein [Inhella sp.]|uniref:hypothetical protein n=1 Tax=Inhella sp. TaxID=1921806 RepID=UPI0035B16909